MSFLHGVEVKELNGGARPIETSNSAIIGIVGTAAKGPVNEPVLIAGSRKEAVKIFGAPDGKHTIPAALDAIFDQTGAIVVIINVIPRTDKSIKDEELTVNEGEVVIPRALLQLKTLSATDLEKDTDYTIKEYSDEQVILKITKEKVAKIKVSYTYHELDETNLEKKILGGVSNSGQYEGIQAFLAAKSVVHQAPRILAAPGFTGQMEKGKLKPANKTIVDDMLAVAERLRAVVISDGPNSVDADAQTFRGSFDSPRLYMVDPYVKVSHPNDPTIEIAQPASARIAGVLAKSDAERGFWYSPSNRPISGITGTVRPIDFTMGDPAARANLLNEAHVTTIIHQDGYRLWGNRTCCSDKKWMFLGTRRTADMINDALLNNHLWAIDENITKTYIDNVVRGVNSFLRDLKSKGAILGGECWADPELNTPDQIKLGKVTFDFDFTPPYPAEHITFRSSLVDSYLEEVI